jgi:hypothetical protein
MHVGVDNGQTQVISFHFFLILISFSETSNFLLRPSKVSSSTPGPQKIKEVIKIGLALIFYSACQLPLYLLQSFFVGQ